MEEGQILRILIADDQPSVLQSLAILLGAVPNVEIAGQAVNGQEAVDECERLRPDLLFLDISMPIKNGIMAAKEIRQRMPETKVIFVTSQDGKGYVRAAFAAGAAGYLLKPRLNEDLGPAISAIRAGRHFRFAGLQNGH